MGSLTDAPLAHGIALCDHGAMAARSPRGPGGLPQPASASIRFEEVAGLYRDAPVGLCLVDLELRFVHANDAFARLFGLESDEMIGYRIAAVLPEPARGNAIAMVGSVIASGQPAPDWDFRWRMPDDRTRERFLRATCHPLERDGRVAGAMTAVYDITATRRAQQEAEVRLRELESIYRNAPVGLSLVDRNLRYLRVNQAIADMNGVSIEEMLGKTYRDLSPETAATAEPFLQNLVERGVSVRNLEVRSTPPADPGVEHVYLFSLDPLTDARGRTIGYLSAVQDVTEARRAEETARHRLRELETVYAHVPVGLCYMDAELRVVHLNQLFARLSEVPLEEQVGRTAPELIHPELAAQLVPQLRYVARTGASSMGLQVRGRLPGPNAQRYTWIAQSHPTHDSDGKVNGIITVLQDVSELAARQRETERVRDRLVEAQRVARVGSWEWDIVAGETWWSRELREIFGVGPAHAPTPDDFFERVHPEDRDTLREQLSAAVAGDRSYRATFRIVRPDLSVRTVFTAARLDRNADGQPLRMVGTCQDVTEFGPR